MVKQLEILAYSGITTVGNMNLRLCLPLSSQPGGNSGKKEKRHET